MTGTASGGSVTAPHVEQLSGAEGNRLHADVFGAGGRPVMLLHGGGQTRHAWKTTAVHLARAGWTAYAVDQRGHGDSAWVESGAYAFTDFGADARAVAASLTARHGVRPAVIGASLGGIASLMASGTARQAGEGEVFAALVLVDITPRVDPDGVAKVRGFMRVHADDGFATVEDAADAVAAYLPHRPRPRSTEGLRKNLRMHPDGRFRWHWDPRFIAGVDEHSESRDAVLVAAARGLTIPTLLVRGSASEIVGEEHARDFLEMVPHAELVDVAGARHMVAGDRNDRFAAAIEDFLRRLGGGHDGAAAGPAASA